MGGGEGVVSGLISPGEGEEEKGELQFDIEGSFWWMIVIVRGGLGVVGG